MNPPTDAGRRASDRAPTMSDKTRLRIEISILALAFGAGGGWAAFNWKLSALERDMSEIKTRVAAMYCASIPEPQRAACR